MEQLPENGSSCWIPPRLQYNSAEDRSVDTNIYHNIGGLTIYEEDEALLDNMENYDQVMTDDALRSWLGLLAHDVHDYETSDVMMTKCISGSFASCNFESSFGSVAGMRHSELDEFKVDILNKCFTSIWSQETENDILKGLYSFLNDIFSTYFRKNATHDPRNDVIKEDNRNDKSTKGGGGAIVRRRRKMRRDYDPVSRRRVDKTAVQKLETFILSTTLNRVTITNENCMKFYFVLAASQTFKCLSGVSVEKVLVVSRLIAINNRGYLGLRNRKQVKQFIKTLALIFERASSSLVHVDKESLPEPDKVVNDDNECAVKEENIYAPIWKWYTDCKHVPTYENIYAPLDFITPRDETDWELADAEFYFVDVNKKTLMHDSMFRTICILYSSEDSELNKIIYSYSSCGIINECSEQSSTSAAGDKILTKSDAIQNSVKTTSPGYQELDSVQAWKNMIRHPCYLDDEEDVFMSETQIASLKIIPPKSEQVVPTPIKKDETPLPRSKVLTVSNGSYELKAALSDSSLETSLSGSYRNINESNDEGTPTEPPKERERFRDKMKTKFKLKSSRNTTTSDNFDSPKDGDEEYFGSNLETVEKDSVHKFVPKVVVECIQQIEADGNITTAGIYRVSGNKTQIESFKKKSNDKKMSKKENRLSLLKGQDIHGLTGILKMFFRELSPPLMPSKIFSMCTSEKANAESIGSSLKGMPAINYQTLKFLMSHLKRVEKEQDENLMNSGNLAICWGLCIFSSSFNSPENFFENDISKCNMLCKKLIEEYGAVFKE